MSDEVLRYNVDFLSSQRREIGRIIMPQHKLGPDALLRIEWRVDDQSPRDYTTISHDALLRLFQLGIHFYVGELQHGVTIHRDAETPVRQIVCPTKLLHPYAKAPTANKVADAGHDISCVSGLKGLVKSAWNGVEAQLKAWEEFDTMGYVDLAPGAGYLFRTGFAQRIQPGWCCLIQDRSSLGGKHMVHRLAGVIDDGYLGEWFVRLVNHSTVSYRVHPGDRIAQGIYQRYTRALCPLVDDLGQTSRGLAGFGSSGR